MLIRANYEKSILVFIFLSGMSSLVYETIWFRQLSVLFGNSTQAAATTLAVFFLGLAAGSHFFGRLPVRSPVKTYALVELGIGGAALAYFFLLRAFFAIQPFLLIDTPLIDTPVAQTLAKLATALALLFPTSFLMGGTLPLVGQILVPARDRLLQKASVFYGVNTAGAVLGILLAGFVLPPVLGFTRSYSIAVMVNLLIGAGAYALYRWQRDEPPRRASPEPEPVPSGGGPGRYYLIIFLSGFVTLGLEVLWTHLFARAIMNDVYSFAVVLFTIILALSIGAFVSKQLDGARDPREVVFALLVSSAFLVGLTPFLFHWLTDGGAPLQADGWGGYLASLAVLSGSVLLLPGILLGTIFPYLLKFLQSSDKSVGTSLGNWISLNLIGGIAGSIFAGFVLVSLVGLLYSILVLALLYAVAAVSTCQLRRQHSYRLLAVLPLVLAAYLTINLDPVPLDPARNETLLKQYQSSYGTTSVVTSHAPHYPEGFDDLFVRQNNYYTLGGTGSIANEKRQAHLPLLLHPQARSVYFLGMGTGITAGAALDHPVRRVVVAEVNPDVVRASRDFFGDYTNGLLSDPRAQLVTADGRAYLRGTSETFDVIVGDLYNPTTRGIASLYTREHFQNVKDHLNPGGVFAQWLPLYQLSEEDFAIIARTFQEVFPETTLWRGNFLADKPVLALVGASDLSFDALEQNLADLSRNVADSEIIDLLVSTKGLGILTINPASQERLAEALPQLRRAIPYTFYAGRLPPGRYGQFAVNRDDFPILEYLTPRNRRPGTGPDSPFLTGHRLERLFDSLAEAPENDPLLAGLTPREKGYVQAGNIYYKSVLFELEAILNRNEAESIRRSQEYLTAYLDRIGLD